MPLTPGPLLGRSSRRRVGTVTHAVIYQGAERESDTAGTGVAALPRDSCGGRGCGCTSHESESACGRAQLLTTLRFPGPSSGPDPAKESPAPESSDQQRTAFGQHETLVGEPTSHQFLRGGTSCTSVGSGSGSPCMKRTKNSRDSQRRKSSQGTVPGMPAYSAGLACATRWYGAGPMPHGAPHPLQRNHFIPALGWVIGRSLAASTGREPSRRRATHRSKPRDSRRVRSLPSRRRKRRRGCSQAPGQRKP